MRVPSHDSRRPRRAFLSSSSIQGRTVSAIVSRIRSTFSVSLLFGRLIIVVRMNYDECLEHKLSPSFTVTCDPGSRLFALQCQRQMRSALWRRVSTMVSRTQAPSSWSTYLGVSGVTSSISTTTGCTTTGSCTCCGQQCTATREEVTVTVTNQTATFRVGGRVHYFG